MLLFFQTAIVTTLHTLDTHGSRPAIRNPPNAGNQTAQLTAPTSGFLQFTQTSPPAGRQFYRLREFP